MQKNQWYLFLVIIAILLVNNWNIPLWDQDEAAYAGFGYTMNETGNWLVPDFMYSDVHRKPPLHFWDVALSFKLFGYTEFGVRFPSFLAILGTFLLLFFQGKKLTTEATAFRSMLVLAGSFLVTAIAKVSVTDATVLFTCTLAAFGIINTLNNPTKKWVFLFWLGFALGILTKGPPVILFSGAFALLLLIFHPKRKNILKLHPWFFLPFAVAPAFIWGYLTYLNDGGVFLSWMYDWYVLQRINGEVFGQTGPIGTHIVAMSLFFLPFFMYIPRAIYSFARATYKKDEQAIVIFCWFIAGWFFYEFSPSKLPAYVIAAHIPFAIMIATQMKNGIPFATVFDKIVSSLHFILQIIIGTTLCWLPFYLELPSPTSWLLVTLGLVSVASTLFLIVKRKDLYFYRYQLGAAMLFVLTAWTIAPQITQLINSSKRVAETIAANPSEVKTVYIGHNFGEQPSLPFYLIQKDKIVIDATHYSMPELLETYTTQPNSAFVLNEERYTYFCTQLGTQIPYKEVQSLIIDRKEKSDYYIIFTADTP